LVPVVDGFARRNSSSTAIGKGKSQSHKSKTITNGRAASDSTMTYKIVTTPFLKTWPFTSLLRSFDATDSSCPGAIVGRNILLRFLERRLKNTVFLLALLAVGTLHGAGSSLAYYQSVYDSEYAQNKATYDSYSSSGVGRDYYTFQYPFGATISMFEATKDVKYLQRALTWGQNMVSAATIIDNNGNKNWSGDWASPYSATPISWLLDDMQGSTELARVARIVLTNPTLKSTYGAQAMVIYNFVRDHIVNKNLYKRAGGLASLQSFVTQTTSAVSDKPELLTIILLDLKLASAALGGADNTTYNYPAVLDFFAKGLKDHNGTKMRWELFKGGLIWDLGMGFEAPYTSVDTMHANRMPPAIIELYRAGIVFDRSYVQGIANLFTKVIWNQSLTDPMFNNFINGSNGVFRNRPAWNNGMIYSGWAKLAEFDAQTFTVADAVLKVILAGKSNPSLDYNDSMWGRIMLAGNLAKAVAASTPPITTPVALNKSVATAQDTAVTIGLSGTDSAGASLAFSVVSQPAHGTLSGAAPNLSYKPSAGYSGSDSFTFKVNNGQSDSLPATVSITITPPVPPTPVTPGPSFVTSKVLGTLRNDVTGWIGMKFTVGASPLTVTALGRTFASGNSSTHLVELVKASDGNAVVNGSVSISMAGGKPGEFSYATLATPVTLLANTSYYLVSQETSGGDKWYSYDSTVTTANVGTCNGRVFSKAPWYTDDIAGKSYGPVDFKYVKGSSASAQSIDSNTPESDSALLTVEDGQLSIDKAALSSGSDSNAYALTSLQDNKIQVTLTGQPGQSYVLESSVALPSWSEVKKVTLTSGTLSFDVFSEPGVQMKFYRARPVSVVADR
jgi:hypothetical protein